MIYIVMLILHMMADFYIQTDTIVKKKKESCFWLVIHALMYGGTFIIPAIIMSSIYKQFSFIYATLVIIVSHFVIDLIKVFIEKKVNNEGTSIVVYLIDQLIHIGILYLSYVVFELKRFESSFQFSVLDKSFNLLNVLIYVLMMVILLKPTSIFVKKCLSVFDISIEGKDTKEQKSIANSGKAIGYFERLLMMILILANQYSLLGLVLTAKSIARFKDFDHDGFAEKYLIGTLASFITSLLTILILKTFLV